MSTQIPCRTCFRPPQTPFRCCRWSLLPQAIGKRYWRTLCWWCRKPEWLQLPIGSILWWWTWRTLVLPVLDKRYSIPYLQFDSLIANGDHFGPELYSNSDLVFLSKAMVNELQQQAAFPDTWASQSRYLCLRLWWTWTCSWNSSFDLLYDILSKIIGGIITLRAYWGQVWSKQ